MNTSSKFSAHLQPWGWKIKNDLLCGDLLGAIGYTIWLLRAALRRVPLCIIEGDNARWLDFVQRNLTWCCMLTTLLKLHDFHLDTLAHPHVRIMSFPFGFVHVVLTGTLTWAYLNPSSNKLTRDTWHPPINRFLRKSLTDSVIIKVLHIFSRNTLCKSHFLEILVHLIRN